MPIIKSAKKRVRVAEKAAIRNSKTKRSLKSALKAFRSSLGGKKAADSQSAAQSAIDTAAKKGLVHRNKAARMKAQLARSAKAAGAEKPAKKTAAKKPAAAKKAPAAKKPAASKKASPSNGTAKKPADKK